MNQAELPSTKGSSNTTPFDEVDTAIQTQAKPDTSGAFLVRIENGAEAPAVLRLDAATPGPLLVGSSQVCALRLRDPEVSRRHLALEPFDGGVRVRDLDSTNGTRVDGVRVIEAVLEGGERIELGSTVLGIERDDQPGPVGLSADTHFFGVMGSSVRMRQLYPLFLRLAKAHIPLVLEGETGTGKEALAEAIHLAGPRASGPFVVFDCTAAAPSLLESELFGHERGAFTGAIAARQGVFEQANGGTLLIDEIGDLDLALQPKLLRAIERSEVRPLGSTHPVRVDVRLMTATRRDLDREVSEGRFRDDLFHRLAVARVELPPLRKRAGDVALLARHFWRELSREGGPDDAPVSEPPPELIRRWEREPWPGNVRQLRNAVARTLALGESIAALDDASRADGAAPANFIEHVLCQKLPLPVAREKVVHEFERRYLTNAMAAHGGSVMRAAAQSGIALRYFQLLRSRRRSEP